LLQYILAFSIQGCRNVRGYRFPAFCNRAERRAVEKMLRSAISADGQTFNGRYYSGNELTDTIMPKKVGTSSSLHASLATSVLHVCAACLAAPSAPCVAHA